MRRSNRYDRLGRSISEERFLLLLEDRGYALIGHAQITVPDYPGYLITTVWTGIDVVFKGPPYIFETLVTRDGMNSPYQDRYTNIQDARSGHNFYVLDLAKRLFERGHRGFTVIDYPPPISLIKESP